MTIDEGRERFYDEMFHRNTKPKPRPKEVAKAPETVTLTMEQYKALLKMAYVGSGDRFSPHFREVKNEPKDSICVGYEQAAYGDWNYYITPDGEYVSTYYNIGD